MTTLADKSLSILIKEKAYDLGFDLCGIAALKDIREHAPLIQQWCSSGMNGDMTWLGLNIEKRTSPQSFFPSAKSVIVTAMNYYTDEQQIGENVPLISRYSYGADYHYVIRDRLNKLLDYLKSKQSDIEGKCFVDSSPVLEKAWAREAGLGWPGRHSILINNKIGSFFFLGGLIINIELNYDEPFKEDHCGDCRICIDACPTGAINENRTIDARKCISYLTVESKNPVPDELVHKLGGRVFGCDKCQELCPWNKNAKKHKVPEFVLSEDVKSMTKEEWENLSEYQFKRLFKGTPVERRKYNIFMRNVTNVKNAKV